MNRSTLITISLFIRILTFSQKSNDNFTGRWKAPKGAIIVVSKSNIGFIGKTEIEKAVVLKDVKFTDGKWVAVVLNPKENKIANCELVIQDSQLKIIVRKGILYKTIIWIKQSSQQNK